ncbi:MAG: dihydropyrimidinase [Cellvibrionaceae bacterium]|jgi:dihydropyrimidinase
MTTTLIKGGTAVIGQTVSKQDLLIQGEKIIAIGRLNDISADCVIDAEGLLVLPGGVDTHVHFNDDFMGTVSVHDYETGSLSAAFGGTTSVIDFSNPAPGATLVSAIENKKQEAAGKALIDYGVHPVITAPNMAPNMQAGTLADVARVVEAGSPTIKCYMTYRGEGLLIEDPDLRKVQAALRDAGGMLLVHAEDNDLAEEMIPQFLNSGRTSPIFHAESKPPIVENTAIENCIKMVRDVGGRLFIVHLTTKEGVEMVAHARAEGLDVLAETCTHYLAFTVDQLAHEDGIKWVCSPPLREKSHQDKLWQAINDGRLVQVVSDDASYSWEATQMGRDRFDLIPNGMPGIGPRFMWLFSHGVVTGKISLPRFVELVSTNPAHIFGMTQKGALTPGKDADIVLLDPKARWTMGQATSHSSNDWHAYEGATITGKITKVFSRGELIIDGDECLAKAGRGRYVHRILPQ